jgi:hypothetical protein
MTEQEAAAAEEKRGEKRARTMKAVGSVLALIGAVILIVAAWYSGSEAFKERPDCPRLQTATGATPQVYLTADEIRLGGWLCLALDRSRVFARERTALDRAEAEVAAAQTALATAGATPAAGAAAQARLNQANAALEALPRERKVFIFLDEVRLPMEGESVSVRQPAGANEWVLQPIQLRATEDASSDAGRDWRAILGGPTGGGTREVRVGVAVREAEDGPPIMRALVTEPATLWVYDPMWVFIGAAGLVLTALGIGIGGWHTGMFRDGAAGTQFSLARVQMAWWLVLTIGGFLFIWLVSGQWRGVMTTGTMALLGISATTGVAASMIEERHREANDGDNRKEDRTKGFFADIVDGGDGAGLHRIQLIAWTILLGGVFAWTVIWRFAFPDFDTNLLLLAGIAGGTYLGFKFQEQTPAERAAEAAARAQTTNS